MLEKIKQIKYSRLKDEERFFLETIDGIQPFKLRKCPMSVYWMKDNIVLLEQDFKNGWLLVNTKTIWTIISVKYNHNFNDTKVIIKDMVHSYTNLDTGDDKNGGVIYLDIKPRF